MAAEEGVEPYARDPVAPARPHSEQRLDWIRGIAQGRLLADSPGHPRRYVSNVAKSGDLGNPFKRLLSEGRGVTFARSERYTLNTATGVGVAPNGVPAERDDPGSAQDFVLLEEIIGRGLHTFIEVGRALLEINERRLYLSSGFASFADYAEKRWSISRSYAYRQIEAARVVSFLEQAPDLPPPANESQARELARLSADPELLREVWSDALRDAGGRVTAGDLRRRIDVRKRRATMSALRAVPHLAAPETVCPHCGGAMPRRLSPTRIGSGAS